MGKGGYRHLGIEERVRMRIQMERENGVSLRSIAACIGRSPSTLSRELAINSVEGRYEPEAARQLY